jgi:branched-chain amino acid aminotransferase
LPVSEGALVGIIREWVLELVQDNGIKTREQPLGVCDLYAADECFLTGTDSGRQYRLPTIV